MFQLVSLDLSDDALAAELLELQRRAYRVEADLIRSEQIPQLRETLAELQACGETFLGARLGGVVAGAISWRLVEGTLDLHRLFVEPRRFRRGLASALVRAALGAEPGARLVTVQTGVGNEPAVALYRSEGFVPAGEVEPLPGLRAVRFTKRLPD